MKTTLRAFSAIVLVLILTGADNALSRAGLLPIPAVALSLSLLSLCLFFALIVFKSSNNILERKFTIIEIIIACACIYGPVFVSSFWVGFAPDGLFYHNTLSIYHMFIIPMIFMLAVVISKGNLLRRTAQIGLLVYVSSVIFDVISGGLLSVLVSRPAGFMSNANAGAFAIVALLIAALPWRRASLSGHVWTTIALIGVAITLSRSGLLMWGTVLILYSGTILLAGRPLSRVVVSFGGFGIVAGMIAVLSLPLELLPIPVENDSAINRIRNISAVVSGDTTSIANDTRVLLFEHYFQLSADRPLAGYGSIFSKSGYGMRAEGEYAMGPHNQFLTRMVDSGILGLSSLLAFILYWVTFFLIRNHRAGLVFCGIFTLYCMFAHDILDRRSILGIFTLLAAEALTHSPSNFGKQGKGVGSRAA